MNWYRRIRGRLGLGGDGDAIEREIEAEIRFHLEMRAEANRRNGMDERAARLQAARSFGDRDRVLAAGRSILAGTPPARDGTGWFETVAQDVRYGIRVLARQRLTTAVAVLSLGLGIGANTANFSVVYGLLHRDLPFADGERLLFFDAWNPSRGDGDAGFTWAELAQLRAASTLEQVGAFDPRNLTVSTDDRPERIAGVSITPGLFESLGVEPQLGRLFAADEAAAVGFEQVALISDGLWERMFGADPDVVGRTIRINDRELVVVGVMPTGFRFPETESLWLPFGTDSPDDHTIRTLRGVGKLREGHTLAMATEQIATLAQEASRVWPGTHEGWTLRALWFRNGYIDSSARQLVYLLFAAVCFVLLLACANVANLLLSRAADRGRELVVRGALGASRARLLRQMLTESTMLGLAGGVVGVVVARLWLQGVLSLVPEEMSYWVRIEVDQTALWYALAVALGTGVLFGILPAIQATRAGMQEQVQSAGRGLVGRASLRNGLVVGELALAVVLLVGAVLMIESFLDLQRADAGFDPDPLLSLRIVLAGDDYDDPAARAEFFRQALARVADAPGVVAAAATGAIPADDGGADVQLLPADGSVDADQPFYAMAVPSTAGFLDTLGIAPSEGRWFNDDEATAPGARVAVLGARLASRLWPDDSAIGREIRFSGGSALRVIGVVPDLQYEEFGEDTAAVRLQVHIPYGLAGWRGMALLVRGRGDATALVDPVRDALAAIDSTQAPYDVMTMTQRRAYTSWEYRLFAQSFGVFGAIALALAIGGVYAVIAYSVTQRTREIGVRIAIGARPQDVLRRVVASGMGIASAGIGLGLVLAYGFTSLLRGILYGVSVHDPRVFSAVAVILATAAALASFIPGRRAAAVDPTEALRAE